MNVLAIIQARMDSKRLPNKVLMDICGSPLLRRLIDRVKATKGIDEIVVATSDDSTDDRLIEWLNNNQIKYFRGSKNNVLDRFYRCALKYNPKYIVRVTADDPLKDPSIIQTAINIIKNSNIDYVSNTIVPTFPEGLDIEVMTFEALIEAHRNAYLSSDLEHVTSYIWRNKDIFTVINFESCENLSQLRLTVDYQEDLDLVRIIFEKFKNDPMVSYQEIIKFIKENPCLIDINNMFMRNEGYKRSLMND